MAKTAQTKRANKILPFFKPKSVIRYGFKYTYNKNRKHCKRGLTALSTIIMDVIKYYFFVALMK